jgi:hypothetical protein
MQRNYTLTIFADKPIKRGAQGYKTLSIYP